MIVEALLRSMIGFDGLVRFVSAYVKRFIKTALKRNVPHKCPSYEMVFPAHDFHYHLSQMPKHNNFLVLDHDAINNSNNLQRD